MIIRHCAPTRRFTRLDRQVIADSSLSDGACRLYTLLCSLQNGANYTDAYLMKAMGISKPVLGYRKRELKEKGLLLVERVAPRLYVSYIGHSNMSVEEVKNYWVTQEDCVVLEENGDS